MVRLLRGLTVVMVAIECLNAATMTLTKAAMSGGMSNLVFLLYLNIVAALFLLPTSFLFYYRKGCHSSLTFPVFVRILILGIISFGMQMSTIYGLKYTSPTQVSAITDVSPAFTFILAAIFGMEKLSLRIESSRAKTLGTSICIAGALTMTLYQGPSLSVLPPLSSELLHQHFEFSSYSNWAVGCLLLVAGCLCLSLLHIIQTWVIRAYPEELIVTLISCTFVIIQCAIVSLVVEREQSAWKLASSAELISILISAILLTAVQNTVHTWACREKGPVYTSMFKPLKLVFAVILGFAFLKDETLHLGSVVGGIFIVVGFYCVIWGQAREQEMVQVNGVCSHASEDSTPLLIAQNLEIGQSL